VSASSKRLNDIKKAIPEVQADEAFELQEEGAVLIDVREPDEVAQGSPTGAKRLVRGFLELKIEQEVPDFDQEILVMCAGGLRSLFAAENLMQMGYTNVKSIAGGYNGWKQHSLPSDIPFNLSADDRERYGRHLLVPEVGEEGQAKLLKSKVLFIGAGGLGSPAAYYLAAAGVGNIGIVDDDVVDRSNLQRQILHTDESVGRPKVDSAKETLLRLNPTLNITTYQTRIDSKNIDEIFKGYDIVVDGTDNFPTRYLINDACVKHGIPNVHGSIFRFEGQVSVFSTTGENPGPCYRCLYPEPPPPELAPSCAEAGVLGILPGVVGMLEAVETVKLILGIGDSLVGRLLHYDALKVRFTELKLARDKNCKYCGDGVEFPGYIDYAFFCSTKSAAAE
jgi:molybdopterin/thiamine biosynthesis adenylyltransferase/rhodanese-related sulfurtransferase